MSELVVNGTRYALIAGEVNLSSLFLEMFVQAGKVSKDTFDSNVMAYHTNSGFRSFCDRVNGSLTTNPGDQGAMGQQFLVAFGGPQAIAGLIQSAKATGAVASERSADSRTSYFEEYANAGWEYAEAWFSKEKDRLHKSYPDLSDCNTFLASLDKLGKGNPSCTVAKMKTQDGKEEKAVAVTFRCDKYQGMRGKSKGEREAAEKAAEQPAAGSAE